jgi:WD40 repeat protein
MDDSVDEPFGPYRIGELLGHGGMGEVHRAYDTVHDRHVALKRLPGFAGDEFRARFRRESRLVAQLSAPHIVPINAYGDIDGRLYLDMALVDGPDLKRLLADGPLPTQRTVEILTQVATALDAAHAAGVLHRDVKPANILLDADGSAYLADFGIARSLAQDVTKLTQTGDYVGTLDYMAPERLMKGDVDAASDVYSLACVLFQCLTGRVPFPATDAVGKLTAQLNDPPPAPSLFDRRIPPAMDLVVRTGMDKDPKRRYPSAGELMAAAAAVTAEAPTAVITDTPRSGDHFVQLLMTFVRSQEETPTAVHGDRCPYPGLQSFGIRDSDWFFGREQAVRDLFARLSRQRADDGPLIVVGASGAGKSSLLHAGLLSAHARAGEVALAMTPGDRPIGTLAARLAALTRSDAHQLAQRLWSRPADFGELCTVAGAGHDAPVVVAIDQAEELFTQCRDPREREAFATALANAWPARVVLAVRADFVEHCITLAPLRPSLAAPYVLGPLTATELARVVTRPAEAAGLELEPGLVDRLVTDVGAGRDIGSLPRLAHALRETWHNRAGNRLTLNGYQRTGGVDRAVALTADGVYERLPERERWALRGALLRMVTLLDGGGIARRRAHRAEVLPRVLESLVAARLVTVDQDSVALSHDALLTAWPRLRQWVEEDRHGLLVRQQLREAVAGWKAGGQDRGDLYRGARLAAALDWSGGRTDLTADESAFLRASERDRRRATNRLRGVVTGLAVLLVVALVAGVLAVLARNDTERERVATQSRLLASRATANGEVDPVGSMAEAVEAWRTAPTTEARGALLSAPLLTYPSSFQSGLAPALSVDVDHDGGMIAAGSNDGKVVLWDVAARKTLDVDIKGVGTIASLKFSPDGKLLAVSSLDSDNVAESGVSVWSVPDGKLVRRLSDVNIAFGHVAWRPDGSAVAAVSLRADNTPWIGEWDPFTGNVIRWVASDVPDVVSLAYHPKGDRLAVGRYSGAVDLWDLTTLTRLSHRTEHAAAAPTVTDGIPINVAYSEQLLASASVEDNKIRLWDPRTGVPVREITDITRHATDTGQGPSTLVFSADGAELYSNSDVNSVSSWDPNGGTYLGSLPTGPRAGASAGTTVLSIAVSGDGRTRVAANGDGTIMRWRTNPSWYSALGGSVIALAFTDDGERFTAGDSDGGLRTWEVATGEEQDDPVTVDGGAFGVRYLPDGTLVTGSGAGTFTLTPPKGRQRSVSLPDREFRGAMAVSPDGRWLVAAHQPPLDVGAAPDNRIHVWDLETLRVHEVIATGPLWPIEFAFTPDGSRLLALTGADVDRSSGQLDQAASHLVSWSVPDFSEERDVELGADSLSTLVVTPDGRSVLTAGTTGRIEVRDVVTGKLRYQFGNHAATVRQLAISPDGRTVASSTTDDREVRLWSLPDRDLVAELRGHIGEQNQLVFSPDGRRLATGGTDTDVAVWYLDPADAMAAVCANLADAGRPC